jgi:hypothetical protein
MTEDEIREDEVQAEARSLARSAGLNPDEILEEGDPEPLAEDRGDGVQVTAMRRPFKPRWMEFEAQAREVVAQRAGKPGAAEA